MAQSVEDLTMRRTPDNTIEDEVDRLADQLAAFCFEHLEEDGNSGDGNNVVNNMDQETFEKELQVRYPKAIRR